ncbi:hypothetical protein CSUI_000524 [Cystoisospora suis]|uniref:Uncharacterized protein n=1 Tax=Cystoisospora suis TaxID=483139 RepID=A0A2C6LF52_9APIC|nr:hypothetical protein CSUI_000524 [Cystoisospora suis]
MKSLLSGFSSSQPLPSSSSSLGEDVLSSSSSQTHPSSSFNPLRQLLRSSSSSSQPGSTFSSSPGGVYTPGISSSSRRLLSSHPTSTTGSLPPPPSSFFSSFSQPTPSFSSSSSFHRLPLLSSSQPSRGLLTCEVCGSSSRQFSIDDETGRYVCSECGAEQQGVCTLERDEEDACQDFFGASAVPGEGGGSTSQQNRFFFRASSASSGGSIGDVFRSLVSSQQPDKDSSSSSPLHYSSSQWIGGEERRREEEEKEGLQGDRDYQEESQIERRDGGRGRRREEEEQGDPYLRQLLQYAGKEGDEEEEEEEEEEERGLGGQGVYMAGGRRRDRRSEDLLSLYQQKNAVCYEREKLFQLCLEESRGSLGVLGEGGGCTHAGHTVGCMREEVLLSTWQALLISSTRSLAKSLSIPSDLLEREARKIWCMYLDFYTSNSLPLATFFCDPSIHSFKIP